MPLLLIIWMYVVVRRLWALMAIYQFTAVIIAAICIYQYTRSYFHVCPPWKKKLGRSWVHAQMHLSLQFIGDFGNLKYLAFQTMLALCRMLKVCECIGARKDACILCLWYKVVCRYLKCTLIVRPHSIIPAPTPVQGCSRQSGQSYFPFSPCLALTISIIGIAIRGRPTSKHLHQGKAHRHKKQFQF